MTKNTLGDLNNILFETLERLNDDEITGEKLAEEIERSKAITHVASKIIDNGKLVLEAQVAHAERMNADMTKPKMLEG